MEDLEIDTFKIVFALVLLESLFDPSGGHVCPVLDHLGENKLDWVGNLKRGLSWRQKMGVEGMVFGCSLKEMWSLKKIM